MKFTKTSLPDVILIEPRVFADTRGAFMETWESKKFAAAGIDAVFVQENHSVSKRWVLRGLHYQLPGPQGKLVRVVAGEVFDVAVDIRRSSATFGHWAGAQLSAANRQMLWIPEGFAHGFLALSEQAEVIYKCTAHYAPAHERVIAWSDPSLAIDWPLPLGTAPLLADRDRSGTRLAAAECFA